MPSTAASNATTSRSTLPAPTGTHPIGRISTECVDRDRVDPYAPDPFTPAASGAVDLVPGRPELSGAPADFLPRPWTPIADQLGVDVNGSTPTPSPTPRRPTGAALCSSSRRAGSHPSSSASIAEELASHGYVVVGVNHTFETAVTVFSDGRVATMNPAALGGALGPQIGPARSGVPSPRRGLQLQGS